VSAVNLLVAFYDVHGKEGEVLFFCCMFHKHNSEIYLDKSFDAFGLENIALTFIWNHETQQTLNSRNKLYKHTDAPGKKCY
jgi:hypothetical protein